MNKTVSSFFPLLSSEIKRSIFDCLRGLVCISTETVEYPVDDDMLFPLETCSYEGIYYPCPRQAEEYLVLRYGDGWRNQTNVLDYVDSHPLLRRGIPENKQYCSLPKSSPGATNNTMTTVLGEMISIFNKVGAPYYIHAGTLLGFVRDCKLKSDIDFALPLKWWTVPDNRKALMETMNKTGYAYYYDKPFGSEGFLGYEEAWSKYGVKIDIFSTIEHDDYMAWALWVNGLEYPCFVNRTSVEEFNWGNLTIRVPVPFDSALTSLYGKHWRDPFPGEWVWDKHPFSVGGCDCDRGKIQQIVENSSDVHLTQVNNVHANSFEGEGDPAKPFCHDSSLNGSDRDDDDSDDDDSEDSDDDDDSGDAGSNA